MYDVGILSLPKSFVMSCLLSMPVSVVAYCLSETVDKEMLSIYVCMCVCAFSTYVTFMKQALCPYTMALLIVVSCQFVFFKTTFKFHHRISVKISLLPSEAHLGLFGARGVVGRV